LHAALLGWHLARQGQGHFLLRIEDIDPARCRAEFEQGILDDLRWAGLDWDGPVRRQSEHLDFYRDGLQRLSALGLIYPCFCSRKDIAAAISAPHSDEGPIYPGTCRALPPAVAAERQARGDPYALRFNSRRAADLTGPLAFQDHLRGEVAVDPDLLG